MSKWQTVNEALDLILDRGPGEDENKEPEEAAVEEEVIVNMFRGSRTAPGSDGVACICMTLLLLFWQRTGEDVDR